VIRIDALAQHAPVIAVGFLTLCILFRRHR
jgi:hypothetical protein